MTVMEKAEKTFRRMLRDIQKAIATMRAVLRNPDDSVTPAVQSKIERELAQLRQMETYCIHALSTLPEDVVPRLLTLREHYIALDHLAT